MNKIIMVQAKSYEEACETALSYGVQPGDFVRMIIYPTNDYICRDDNMYYLLQDGKTFVKLYRNTLEVD